MDRIGGFLSLPFKCVCRYLPVVTIEKMNLFGKVLEQCLRMY